MDFSLRSVLDLARFSVESPRAAARGLIAANWPVAARWMLYLLSVIGSNIASYVGVRLLPEDAQVFWADAMTRPLQNVIMQAIFWLVAIIGLHALGRWGTKKGSFEDTLVLVAWWQLLLFGLQFAQVVALVVFPLLGELMGLLGFVGLMWILTQFIIELHGFQRFWPVFAAVIGVLLLGILAVILVLAIVIFAMTGGV